MRNSIYQSQIRGPSLGRQLCPYSEFQNPSTSLCRQFQGNCPSLSSLYVRSFPNRAFKRWSCFISCSTACVPLSLTSSSLCHQIKCLKWLPCIMRPLSSLQAQSFLTWHPYLLLPHTLHFQLPTLSSGLPPLSLAFFVAKYQALSCNFLPFFPLSATLELPPTAVLLFPFPPPVPLPPPYSPCISFKSNLYVLFTGETVERGLLEAQLEAAKNSPSL